jgi:NitT/TauT family transport system ATP-binding protein
MADNDMKTASLAELLRRGPQPPRVAVEPEPEPVPEAVDQLPPAEPAAGAAPEIINGEVIEDAVIVEDDPDPAAASAALPEAIEAGETVIEAAPQPAPPAPAPPIAEAPKSWFGSRPLPPWPVRPSTPPRLSTGKPAAEALLAREWPLKKPLPPEPPAPVEEATVSDATASETIMAEPVELDRPGPIDTASFESALAAEDEAVPAEPAVFAMPTPAPAPVEDVIDIQHLGLTFSTRDGPVEALSGIDLKVKRGEFVSLIGPSGCGKTTLLRVIADLERGTSGSISVNGVTPEEARLNRAYGYVFQAPALYPWRTIARNVALPLEIMGLGAMELERRVQANLELVNLAGFERKYPWQLSGGMQQRASIARALAVEPDLLLMDEPFGALDEIVRDHLNEQLLSLWAKTNKTVVFVTHSIPEAVFLSSRIVVMTPRPGKVYDIIESTLPRDRNLDIRETPEFLKIAHRVRQGLRAGHSYED